MEKNNHTVKTVSVQAVLMQHVKSSVLFTCSPCRKKTIVEQCSVFICDHNFTPKVNSAVSCSTKNDMPVLSREERYRALGHIEAGVHPRRVARTFNVHISTIYRLVDRYATTGTADDAPRPGQPRVTSARQDRYILRTHRQNRFLTAAETARQLPGNRQQGVCADTIRHRLDADGQENHRPYRGPILTARHRRDRLQWAQARVNWRNPQWRRVLFTDESRFCIDNADGRIRVWRRPGERYADACVLQRNPWGGPSVMIWAGIGLNNVVGPFVFQNLGPGRGNGVNAHRYINQMLVPHVLPFFANNPGAILQQDNARPHVARATQAFLQANNIPVMPWPALSPDLNPIEHYWDEIGQRLNRVQPRPATAAGLAQDIMRVSAQIPQATIDNLVQSMYRRCRAVIQANGGHTDY